MVTRELLLSLLGLVDAICTLYLWTFPMNETPVGGREQRFTDDESLSLFVSTTF